MQHAECWVLLGQFFRVEHFNKGVKRFPLLEKLLKSFLVSDLSVPCHHSILGYKESALIYQINMVILGCYFEE